MVVVSEESPRKNIQNIKEITDKLLDNEWSDEWKRLNKQEMDSLVMYVVMQYRLVLRHHDEELHADVLKAIGRHQRLAAKVFDHIHNTDPNKRLF